MLDKILGQSCGYKSTILPFNLSIKRVLSSQCTSSSEEDLKPKHVLPILFYSRHLRSFELYGWKTYIFEFDTLLLNTHVCHVETKYDLHHQTFGVLVEWLHQYTCIVYFKIPLSSHIHHPLPVI